MQQLGQARFGLPCSASIDSATIISTGRQQAHRQRLVEVPAPHDVRIGDGEVGVDGVLGAAAPVAPP